MRGSQISNSCMNLKVRRSAAHAIPPPNDSGPARGCSQSSTFSFLSSDEQQSEILTIRHEICFVANFSIHAYYRYQTSCTLLTRSSECPSLRTLMKFRAMF